MPQAPSKTKSWWNPKGYFTEREEKIIVNAGERLQQPRLKSTTDKKQ